MPFAKSPDRVEKERVLDEYGLLLIDQVTGRKTLLNPDTGRIVNFSLANINKIHQRVVEEETVHSITIKYHEQKAEFEYDADGNKVRGDMVNTGMRTVKLVQKAQMSKEEAISYVRQLQRDKNDEYDGVYKLRYINHKNTPMLHNRALEESKMYDAKFEIFSEKMSAWKQTNEMECVYDYLRYRYSSLNLTNQQIHEAIFDEVAYKYDQGVSCVELERFCRKYGITMYAVDATDELFYKYVPPKRDHHKPVLAFICSNNHMYPIEEAKYIKHYAKVASNTCMKQEKKEVERTIPTIIETEDLSGMLDEYLVNGKFPEVSRHQGRIVSLKFGKDKYVACAEKKKIAKLCEIFGFEMVGQTIALIAYELFKQTYPSHQASNMNEKLLHVFTDNNKSGFIYTWREPTLEEEKYVTRYDISKCYTNILLNNTYDYPVFGVTDDVEEYDGKGLRRGFFWVETDNIFPLKRSGWYSYSTLRECELLGIDFEIKWQVLASSWLPAGYFSLYVEEAKQVLEYDETQSNFKKLTNFLVGLMNKQSVKRASSRFTTDYNEAGYFFFNKFKAEGNKIVYCTKYKEIEEKFKTPKRQREDAFNRLMGLGETIYEIETETVTENYDNNIPIYHQVVETGWIHLYKLSRRVGGELLSAKVDAISVIGGLDIETTPAGIGTVHIEDAPEKYPDVEITGGNAESLEELQWDEVEEQQYAEEYKQDGSNFPWMDDIVEDIFNSNEGMLIDGRAGTGKSVVIRKLNQLMDERGLKYINLAPTNTAARNIGGQTIHKALGLCDGRAVGKCFEKLLKNEYVLLDEFSMVGSLLLKMLYLLKKKKPSMKFIFFGDHRQLPPIDEKEHFNSYCAKVLCDGNKLNLNINKRFDAKLRKIADRWYNEKKINLRDFTCKTPPQKYLCYTNKTRMAYNEMMMEENKGEDYDTIEVVKAVVEKHKQDIIVYEGLPIISSKNRLDMNICNNEEFLVTGIDKERKKVFIDNEEFSEFSYKDFGEMFRPAYAITIHKSQGKTYKFPYRICELGKIVHCKEARELLYVALTRASDMRLISFEQV